MNLPEKLVLKDKRAQRRRRVVKHQNKLRKNRSDPQATATGAVAIHIAAFVLIELEATSY